ncbi:molybdopterin-dependent oxidoreductase [Bacillus sp. 1P06AnD]|uniref:molybdopterin-dependent oxidoreductase n=1 Tax=Bacillus sp. 1P06AnD TaxID=3132208 RepID=UPI0039A169C4
MDAFIYDFGDVRNSDPSQLSGAETIILWGANPLWTSIHTIPFIYEAKSKGATIVTIDPVYTATAKKSDLYLQITRKGRKTMVLLGFGLQCNSKGGQNIRAINAFMAMTGNIGSAGRGLLYADRGSGQFSESITQYYNHGYTAKDSIRPVFCPFTA